MNGIEIISLTLTAFLLGIITGDLFAYKRTKKKLKDEAKKWKAIIQRRHY